MSDKREEEFTWWHDAVFGSKPTKVAIPFRVMRGYLDLQRELARATGGIDDELMALSIPEIKRRGKAAYSSQYGKTAKLNLNALYGKGTLNA